VFHRNQPLIAAIPLVQRIHPTPIVNGRNQTMPDVQLDLAQQLFPPQPVQRAASNSTSSGSDFQTELNQVQSRSSQQRDARRDSPVKTDRDNSSATTTESTTSNEQPADQLDLKSQSPATESKADPSVTKTKDEKHCDQEGEHCQDELTAEEISLATQLGQTELGKTTIQPDAITTTDEVVEPSGIQLNDLPNKPVIPNKPVLKVGENFAQDLAKTAATATTEITATTTAELEQVVAEAETKGIALTNIETITTDLAEVVTDPVLIEKAQTQLKTEQPVKAVQAPFVAQVESTEVDEVELQTVAVAPVEEITAEAKPTDENQSNTPTVIAESAAALAVTTTTPTASLDTTETTENSEKTKPKSTDALNDINPTTTTNNREPALANVPASLVNRQPLNAGTSTNATKPNEGLSEIDRVRFVQRVARAFQSVGEREGEIRLKLSPPELGALKLEVSIRNGVLNARLEAETTTARNLLLDNLPQLKERLAEQNVKIESFEVDVRDHTQGQAHDNAEQMREQQELNRNRLRSSSNTTPVLTAPITRSVQASKNSTQLNLVI
jgi:flagellar hook-length control protein FliK